ncbi:MAG: LamG domain-containing protein [Candidatus Micrarchaeota archaeon]|nr:LamG domain-containing protein [Candidatus Micrarchaeota archaeon]
MIAEGKLQSAMEYLMTYGWAILAIAIVMVSLYSLGIFNAGNLTPTAAPGSCEVVRTVAQTSFAGQCGNLIPKYVGVFLNPKNAYVTLSKGMNLTGSFTVSMWTEFGLPITSHYYNLIGGAQSNTSKAALQVSMVPTSDTSLTAQIWVGIGVGSSNCAFQTGQFDNKWHNVVVTYNGTYITLYVDKQYIANRNCAGPYDTPLKYIAKGGWNNVFNGTMSNVQIYNASLDTASIVALYQEGIGGAPIDVKHLMGWWPLNGNANDYSGNNNQGTQTNVNWNANWQSGYAAPKS